MSVRSSRSSIASFPDTMPWFTKYVEGVVKGVNDFFQERSRAKMAGASASLQRKPSARRKRPGNGLLEVTCCTGRHIAGRESCVQADPARAAAKAAKAAKAAAHLAEEAGDSFTEEDFRFPPDVAYPKANKGSLYSFLLVDLKGHVSLHARSHRLSWVQHNIPGAAFSKGDLSAGTACTPYRAPCCRRGSLHVLALVFEQSGVLPPQHDVSPVFAEDSLRLSTWLSRFGGSLRRMVVCEEFQAHVQRSAGRPSDTDSCSSSSVELEMPTVSFHKLESPKKPKTATTAFFYSEQNGWVPAAAVSPERRKHSCTSPTVNCANKRMKVF